MTLKNSISILILASFLFSQVFAYSQAPDVPNSPQPQREKGSGPHALGIAAKEPPSQKKSSVKWLIIGGLVIAAGVVLYVISSKSKSSPAEKIGSIAIDSDPTGAKVFLDGSDTGQLTSCTLDSVKAGLHNLRIDLESFGRWEGQVEVKENQTAHVSAKLAPYKYVFVAKWGSYGTGDGQFYRPSGLAIDGSDNLYVSDSFNNRIQKFTASGAFLAKWGGLGTADGQFNHPLFLALDKEGHVYVTEYDNHRVQKFSSDGLFLGKWGSQGTGEGQFHNPSGIIVDKAGYVLVGDSMNHRIQKFTTDGKFVTTWGSFGTGDGQFNQVSGIAQDSQGFIYASDYDNNRIQKFRLSTETMAAAKIAYTGVSLRKPLSSSPTPRSLKLSGSNSDASRKKPGPVGERKFRED